MGHERRLDLGALIIGLVIVGVGGWFLLQETFGFVLPELNWDLIWPVIVIAVGLGILWRAWERGRARA